MLKNFWEKIKTWFKTKLLPWLIKNWMIIVNYLIIFIAYSIVYDHEEVIWAELLLGLWMFASVAYAGYKWFINKPKLNPQPEPPKPEPEPVKPVVKKPVVKK